MVQGKKKEMLSPRQQQQSKILCFDIKDAFNWIFSLSHSLPFNQRTHLNFNLCMLAISCQRKSQEETCNKASSFELSFIIEKMPHQTIENNRKKSIHLSIWFSMKVRRKSTTTACIGLSSRNLFVLEIPVSSLFFGFFVIHWISKSIIIFDWVHFFIRFTSTQSQDLPFELAFMRINRVIWSWHAKVVNDLHTRTHTLRHRLTIRYSNSSSFSLRMKEKRKNGVRQTNYSFRYFF